MNSRRGVNPKETDRYPTESSMPWGLFTQELAWWSFWGLPLLESSPFSWVGLFRASAEPLQRRSQVSAARQGDECGSNVERVGLQRKGAGQGARARD